MTEDREVLASVFAARVVLAKKQEAQVVEEAVAEYHRTLTWLESRSQKPGSFLWFCDEFDLDPATVRREILKARVA